MQVESETPSLMNLESSTEHTVDIQHIDELFDKAGLQKFFYDNYSHIAEVVSNVYQHATCESKVIVSWGVAVSRTTGFLCISIFDDGQGIRGSIGKSHPEPLTDSAAIKLALSLGSRIGHRGKGLESVIRDVSSGRIHSVEILSGSCSFTARAEGDEYNEIASKRGTEVRLTIRSNGESQ